MHPTAEGGFLNFNTQQRGSPPSVLMLRIVPISQLFASKPVRIEQEIAMISSLHLGNMKNMRQKIFECTENLDISFRVCNHDFVMNKGDTAL